MLVRAVDVDFISCPTFHWLGHSDHKLVMARLLLGDKPRLAGYWKFNCSLLEREDFRDQLVGLIQRDLVGAVTGNKWWGNLKHRIRTFTVKYSQRLAVDKATAETLLEDKISRAMAGGDSLTIEIARSDLQQAVSARYEGQVVRARLDRVSNEAVKLDASMRKEEMRRWPNRYIRSVKTPDGQILQSTRDICDGFRQHLQKRFTKKPSLCEQEFRSYLADFPRLGSVEAASCEGEIRESEVLNALKQVGRNKSPGLDGLPYEMYLRLSHIFVPLLTVMFNHWFNQGGIPGQVTKGVITLLKKGDTDGGEELDDYRPITLLNTELKIMAKILSNRLRVVIEDLVGPDQNYAVKERSIQNNLHTIRTVLEGIEDDTEAALIHLDQAKAFDRVDHQFLATVLETAGFEPGFRKWIGLLYQTPKAVVQVNGRRSKPFAVTRSVRQGCPLSPLLYVLALEPLLRRLRDRAAKPALRGIGVPGGARAKVCAYADDVSAFVSCRRDIKAVHKAVARYEKVTGAKINRGKSKGLRLGAWRGSVPLPGPFSWTDGPIRILGVWYGPDLQLEKNWSEVHARVETSVGIWLRRRLSLKGRAEACVTYVFPLILYRMSVLPLPTNWMVLFERLLFSLLWRRGRPRVRREVCIQRPCNGGLGMPHMASHRHAERLAFLNRTLTEESAWEWKVRNAFPKLEFAPRVEGRRKPKGQAQFLVECRRALNALPRSSDLLRPRKVLYRDLVEGAASDPLQKRLGLSDGELRSLWSWAPGADYLNNSEFSLTWRLVRNGLPLMDSAYKVGYADMFDCPRCNSGIEETAEHAFFYCEKVRPLWGYVNEVTARIDCKKPRIPLDVAYVCDNVSPPWIGQKRMVFLTLLAVARMVIWTTRLNEIHKGHIFSHQNLIKAFQHQLRVKIR